ncbi:MAG TPA: urate hydroxylase PuuD [Caulobacteraceae bacterium]|nr:urate hydroxylase PuuD [Caulobacteraceae bacterium]
MMGYDLAAWLNLGLRWLHVLTGVCWIGASFYFVWLDNHLVAPETPEEGVKGELWAVHGGGFYQARKFLVAPPRMPAHLHWFMWEAYTTWLSGFALLIVIYYLGADIYLIDPAKLALTPGQAIGLSLAFILGGLAVYEGLCRTPLAKTPALFGAVWFAALTFDAWAQTRIFSDRAAFIQIGATIGTVMVGNVFLVIIPNQRKSVAAMLAGLPVDPRLGAAGRLRSVQNNYMTLPVIFLMISNHYAIITSHPLNWLLLAMLAAAGVSVRHFFMLLHRGVVRHDFLFYGFLLFFGASVIATWGKPAIGVAPVGKASFAQAQAIVQTHCVMCHSPAPTHKGFTAPPANVELDTPAHIQAFAPRVYDMAVARRAMPLGNETHMTDAERATLGAWIQSGAKLN